MPDPFPDDTYDDSLESEDSSTDDSSEISAALNEDIGVNFDDQFVGGGQLINQEVAEDYGISASLLGEGDPDSVYVYCDELFRGRRGRPFASTMVREYFRYFRVMVTDKTLGSVGVCKAPCIPLPYSPYISGNGVESDLAALCVEIDAAQELDDDWQSWIVTCRYSTEVPDAGPDNLVQSPDNPNGSQNNPALEPPDIEWDEEEMMTSPMYDLDGKAYLNSAMQPFTPAPQFPIMIPVLVVTRNQTTFSQYTAVSYANAVNSDTFLGNPPGTVQCKPPKAKIKFRGSIRYYRVTYRLRIRTDTFTNSVGRVIRVTWQPQILDAGTMELQKVLGFASNLLTPIPIMKNGFPVAQPVLLDGTGSAARPDGTGKYQPQYIFRRQFRSLPFGALFSNIMG